ncbi:hypothetical protein [Niabella ginsengisoli]|uniref:Uncharacterized protein n=1 Tax=Niabella ginsengisoli TaxID=522298 RepID=A0ABS9SP15_9BACT|nr:hypothetical protein [Niabella ginsengisoli]MCH5600011.1 hypothetical protein [Niabella ginsengisoli]
MAKGRKDIRFRNARSGVVIIQAPSVETIRNEDFKMKKVTELIEANN